MARNSIPSPDEALAGMARIGAPRQPMGNAIYSTVENASGAPSKHTIQMPKKNKQAGDPTAMGTKVNRQFGSLDRNGPRFGIGVNYAAPVSPEAAATQANGRIFKSAINRDRVNFDMGAAASMR